eukprot:CAMPEP_0174230438 /NCGR_PEP_ID=MMETSP0417-20130205/1211_1 /TAXON_ID=242541 /ORGANISM="Mayorella sp, Strain BSH-02190019" /LENGTH=339 /DNA_ID=CAMNT_0015308133 /DNA_START=117 /DNA_END=1136 /DNA_ORIENTATION=+
MNHYEALQDSDELSVLKAPSAPVLSSTSELSRARAPDDFVDLTADEAMGALERHAKERFCLRSNVTHEFIVVGIDTASAVHLIFEASTEQRATKAVHVPHLGGPVDGPHNGPPPAPWEIHAVPNSLFCNEKRQLEVPHTSTVLDCFDCARRGTVTCKSCTGNGRTRCPHCYGKGTLAQGGRCVYCHGRGNVECTPCRGDGFVQCATCAGNGLVRRYAGLDITWKLNKLERIIGEKGVPERLIRNVSGVTLFQEEDAMLAPIDHIPDASINSAANELMARGSCPPDERLLRQRMMIRAVPVYRVQYRWKDDRLRTAWVYGTERRVYEKDFPTLCTGCTIL